MTTWQWQILGQPIGKGRPRLVMGARPHVYTPHKTARWEAEAASVLATSWRFPTGLIPPLDEPVGLEVTAVFARPKCLMGKRHTDGRLPHAVRPDGDNVLKAVCDALKNAGVVRDDALIWRATVVKLYAARAEGPRVEVTLTTMVASSADQPEAGVVTPSPALRLVPSQEETRG